MTWPPLARLLQLPEPVLTSSTGLAQWAQEGSASLAEVRWSQELLEGALRLKAEDPVMLRWAQGEPALRRLAAEPLDVLFAALLAVNRYAGRLGLDVALPVGGVLESDSAG